MTSDVGFDVSLLERAVACKHWRWIPGMLTTHGRVNGDGFLVVSDVDETGRPFVDCADTTDAWPDAMPGLHDPATLGGLLALVREAWVDAGIYAGPVAPCDWRVYGAADTLAEGATEAEALVAALEGAP